MPPVSAVLDSAIAAERSGDDRAAARLYRQAHEADPAATAPLAAWGRLAVRIGADEQAAALLSAALDTDPGNASLSAELADVLIALNRTEDALALYDAALEEDPFDAVAHSGRAHIVSRIAEERIADLGAERDGRVVARTDEISTDPGLLTPVITPRSEAALPSTAVWR